MTIRSWTPATRPVIATRQRLHSSHRRKTSTRIEPAAEARLSRVSSPASSSPTGTSVPIDIVLIGFDDLNVGRNDIRTVLAGPATRPSSAIPSSTVSMGGTWDCATPSSYSITRASQGLTNRFFSYLAGIGKPIEPTIYQLAYNDQDTNLIDVTGPVLDIEAARVERWLEQNANPRRAGYTIYFINWYGRKDFRFHVYTKKDDPDPDTKHNFGERASRAITSWGGTTSRTWFYDFSAGPEWNTDSWVVDTTDLNGDGVGGLPDAADLGVLDLRLPLANAAGT